MVLDLHIFILCSVALTNRPGVNCLVSDSKKQRKGYSKHKDYIVTLDKDAQTNDAGL